MHYVDVAFKRLVGFTKEVFNWANETYSVIVVHVSCEAFWFRGRIKN